MGRYLLLARADNGRPQDKRHSDSIRGSLEQLSRDPTISATYGILDDGALVFALLCEVPSCHGADELAAMAGVYGLTRIETLPLIDAHELRESLSGAPDGGSAQGRLPMPAANRQLALAP